MSDEATEKRKAKIGAGVLERTEAARDEAARFASRAPEQPALFELVGAAEPLPDDDKPAGPGRPVGARATVPQEYRRYILSTKGDFLARFAGLAQVDTFALAKLLGCTPKQALELQIDMGKMAAPYVYQPQPRPELERAADYFAGLLFVQGAKIAGAEGKTMVDTLAALAGRPPDLEEIQALEPVKFDGSEPAHSEPKDKAP